MARSTRLALSAFQFFQQLFGLLHNRFHWKSQPETLTFFVVKDFFLGYNADIFEYITKINGCSDFCVGSLSEVKDHGYSKCFNEH